MPLATTVNIAEEPEVTVCATGCVVMTGATLTVSFALLLVTVPATLVTITVYVPVSVIAAALIVYDAVVAEAPVQLTPFFCHW